jgi:Phage ABA sandwich domain
MNLREIDRLVAEKVMGWIPQAEIGEKILYVLQDGTHIALDWKPSSKIAHAWDILDQFRDYEFGGTPSKNKYYCNFKKDGNWFSAESSVSQEHAICLAALKAVGVEVHTK